MGSKPARAAPFVRSRLVRGALALLASGLLALVAAELGARWLLFSDNRLAARWGASLRGPGSLADSNTDEYWKLQWLFERGKLKPAPTPDTELGWLGPAQAGTYAHRDEALLRGRRPVLLFGDSFAECATAPEECFQALLERSELAREYALLNYGVGGYGLDQIALLQRHVLPRFAGQKPFVVVGVMLDDDFNRSLLGVRGWPKPRARLERGELRIDPAGETDPERYLEQHPLGISSWFWRLLVYRDGSLPRRWQDVWRDTGPSIAERVAVNRALLDAIAAELDAAAVEHVFLFFNGEPTLFDEPSLAWTVELARSFERETHQPCSFTTPFLRAGACGEPERAHLFFGASGRELGHYNAFGNRVVFEALRQGILHPGAPPDLAPIEALCASGALAELSRSTRAIELPACHARLSAHSREACIRFQRTNSAENGGDLWLRAGVAGPTVLECELDGRFQRLRARVERVIDGPSTCVAGAVRVSIDVDGVTQAGWTLGEDSALAKTAAGGDLALALGGAKQLRIVLGSAGAKEECGWIVLRGFVLE